MQSIAMERCIGLLGLCVIAAVTGALWSAGHGGDIPAWRRAMTD